MHSFALILHSWLRWTVVLLFVVVVVRTGRRARPAELWSVGDERAHRLLVATADLQLLFGLWLYVVVSPLPRAFWAEPGRAMPDSTLRFFGIEHVTAMLLGLTALHVGRSLSRRAPNAQARRRRVFRWTLGAFVLVLAGIPWPFLRAGRPLFRLPRPAAAQEPEPTRVAACAPAYFARCAPCHGKLGRGDGLVAASLRPPPRDFTDRVWGARTPDERLRAVVREGGARSGLSVAMPANPELTDRELAELVACIRSFGAPAP